MVPQSFLGGAPSPADMGGVVSPPDLAVSSDPKRRGQATTICDQ